MTKEQVREQIERIGIMPVVRASSAKLGRMAVEGVCAGGIPVAEITMTVPNGTSLIQEVARELGGHVLVGAGTVLDVESAKRCLQAGAQFVVSPGLDESVISYVRSQGVLIIAGALTPTEIMAAWKAGSDIIKIFPCGSVGGASYLRALRGPFPDIPMIPTGGVNLQTAAEFIAAGAIALGVGGELVSSTALSDGKPHLLTENARRFMQAVAEARANLRH